jgi:hypothetical protein
MGGNTVLLDCVTTMLYRDKFGQILERVLEEFQPLTGTQLL